VAVDRRTSGAQLEDEGIELRASARLRDAMGERSHVNVTSYNRQVLLTGEVPSDKDKQPPSRSSRAWRTSRAWSTTSP
jgi:osmotically-inducible protein OsmY